MEAARFLGQRMLKEGGQELKDRVAWAFRTATARTPTAEEAAVLVALFEEQRAWRFITSRPMTNLTWMKNSGRKTRGYT